MPERPPPSATAKRPAQERVGTPPSVSLPADTDSDDRTPLPHDHDPVYEKLGATRVVEEALQTPSGSGPTPAPVVGHGLTRLGEFEIVKKIGEGAMGAVYLAKQASFRRDVALKVLFGHVANNPKLVERMYREGRAMAALDHPNIVQAYAVGEDQGCHYVAMEYVDGQNLQKWLARVGRLGVADAVRIVLVCARALAYAHQQGIVHRDIKPDNILVTATGDVKLADLGMVKTFDDDMGLTQTGHAVGTPWYMPLEQARNAKETDGRSDIYALGCTLYCFLTGTPPFAAKTIIEVVKAKEVGTFPPARKTNHEVPERLDLIIAKMTAKLPQYRYQTCDELIKDLESLLVAGETLAFLTQDGPTPPPAAAPKSPSSVETQAVPGSDADYDPDVWYVRLKMPDGKSSVRKYSTAQLQKMLAEGTLDPKAKASHHAGAGYRALATYRELQGVALVKASRQAADRSTAQYRNLYKKIEEKERLREASERVEPIPEWKQWLWLGLKIAAAGAGLILIFVFFHYIGTGLGGR
jgi:serine/threonine-protein kinase